MLILIICAPLSTYFFYSGDQEQKVQVQVQAQAPTPSSCNPEQVKSAIDDIKASLDTVNGAVSNSENPQHPYGWKAKRPSLQNNTSYKYSWDER